MSMFFIATATTLQNPRRSFPRLCCLVLGWTLALLLPAAGAAADELLVRSGATVAGKELVDFPGPLSMNDWGDVLFVANFFDDGSHANDGVFTEGLFLVKANGEEVLLAMLGETVGGHKITDRFLSAAINNAGEVVFTAFAEGGFILAAVPPDGDPEILRLSGEEIAGVPWGTEFQWPLAAINNAGDVVVTAGHFSGDLIFLMKADGAERLLHSRDPELFGPVRAISVNRTLDVVYEADGEAGASVWTLPVEGPGQRLRGDAFLGFGRSPDINDAGDVAVERFDGGVALQMGEGAQVVIEAGAIVDGKTLWAAGRPSLNNSGDLTLRVDFEGGGSGVLILRSHPLLLFRRLITSVELVNARNGVKNSLDVKLQNALDALLAATSGKRHDTVTKIEAFTRSVEAARGGQISNEEADYLLEVAFELLATLD